MFSDNHMISERQWYRLIVTGWIGVSVVYLPAFLVRQGQGLILLAAGIFLSLIYAGVMRWFRIKMGMPLIRFLREKAGRICGMIAALLLVIRLVPLLFLCWKELVSLICERLLPDSNPVFLLALLVFVSVYLVWQGIECRGRSAELIYWVLVIPVVLVIFAGLVRIVREGSLQSLMTSDLLYGQAEGENLFLSLFLFLYLFCPAELLLMTEEEPKRLNQSVLFSGLLAVLSFVACLGIFGYEGMKQESAPLVALTGFFNLFGSAIFRHDSIFMCFLLLSFFMQSGILLAGITVSVSACAVKKEERQNSHPGIAVALAFILFLAGWMLTDIHWAGGKKCPDLEDKAYLLALGIDQAEGGYLFTYSFSGADGQNMEFTCVAENGKEAEQEFEKESSKKLEFSHVQAVVLGKRCFDSEICMSDIMGYLSDNQAFSSDTLFLQGLPDAISILSADTGTETGIFIKDLAEKEEKNADSTVGRVTNAFRNGWSLGEVIVLRALNEDMIEMEGTVKVGEKDSISQNSHPQLILLCN